MVKLEYQTGATPLDPDEAHGLLLSHITTQGELDRWEQENIIEAIEWLDKKKPKTILNEQFIKELHKRMFCNVWDWAGKFRKSDKNLGCEWHQIPMLLKGLFEDTKYWIKQQKDTHDEIAVRFHHRLVSIHPFPNGNGRHARLMTDALLENVLEDIRFSWGSENLSKTSEARKTYIDSLKKADNLNYKTLLHFARS